MLTWFTMTAGAAGFDALLIGNSYTDANDLDESLAADLSQVPAWSGATVMSLTAPGFTWSDHLHATQSAPSPGASAEQLDEPYDVVVLQEQSQIPGFDQNSDTWRSSVDALVGLDALAASLGADTILMMTWGRREGDPDNPSLYPDFPAMQDHLDSGYLGYAAALKDEGRGGVVAPVGRAFRAIYDQGAEPGSLFWNLYAGDGSHPSPYGTFLAQNVLFATLCGRDPAGLDWPERDDLDPELLDELRNVAADVVLGNAFGDLYYPWALPWEAGTEGVVRIGAAGTRPVVRVNEPATADEVWVGIQDGVLAGDGELRVDGGSLTVDDLILGDVGEGLLSHRSGDLNVEMGIIAEGGRWVQSGGTLSVRSLLGHLEQDGGRLTVSGPTTIERWSMGPEAEVALTPGAGLVVISEDAVLAGTVVLQECVAGPVVKRLDAASIEASRLVLSGCPEARLSLTTGGVDVVIDAPDSGDVHGDLADPQGCASAPGSAAWGLGWVAAVLLRRKR